MSDAVVHIDTTAWSGDGAFTQALIDHLRTLEQVAALKIEDAPATRSEADYNFICNEIFVTFGTAERKERGRRFGIFPTTRRIVEKTLDLGRLAAGLEGAEAIGAPDYSDDGMIQYLRTERVVPPYQTRGYKLVELVRIYEAGTQPRS